MKFMALIFTLLLTQYAGAAKPAKSASFDKLVYACKDGAFRSFTVFQNTKSEYRALFLSYGFLNSVETYNCKRSGRSLNFNCENGDSEARLVLNPQRVMTVVFTLKGTVRPDSHPLFTMGCKP